MLQRVELNCGRVEARAIEAFGVCSEQVCFPYAARAAMLMQRADPCADPKDDGVVFLLTSRAGMGAEELLRRKRDYWDIENGAHQRLDGSRLQEDKSRVRNRKTTIGVTSRQSTFMRDLHLKAPLPPVGRARAMLGLFPSTARIS